MSTVTQYKHLEWDPKSNYRQLCIRGRGIRARTLYGHYMSAEEPRTPEEIAEDYALPLPAVQEAIAYCQTDPPEIREDFEREAASIREMGLDKPPYIRHQANSAR